MFIAMRNSDYFLSCKNQVLGIFAIFLAYFMEIFVLMREVFIALGTENFRFWP